MPKEAKTEIRVRLAPSPTGFLHIGTARAGLFNYLFAKKNKGKFILRIEDTDQERSKPEYEADIIEGLQWLGIKWDEGPFRQSDRPEIYRRYLEKLLNDGHAYYCFCAQEELEAMKQEQMSRGEAPRYNGKCANLSNQETKKRLADGETSVVRFRAAKKKISFTDLIRGEVEFDSSLFGDFVIAKDLNSPLYNFAVIIDDYEMRISHVIRGEDHISNTPKQILIQEILGFSQPQYAHLPLILGPDRSKLSKRHGATSLLEYRKQGYLSEALVNFMAFLGWNPGTDQEIFSMTDLIRDFSLDKVQKAGAIFNIQKLDYLNGAYIREKTLDELLELALPYLSRAELIREGWPNREKLKEILALYHERLKKLSELPELIGFFFKKKLDYPKELLIWKGMTDQELKLSLNTLEETLSAVKENNFTKGNLEKILMKITEKAKDRGGLLWPLRVALTGQKASAGPFDVAAVLGKEKTLERIREAKLIAQ
ncbi:MAG: glutamate--tRNA ligase [Candidatus Nealsonbacteria bacterium]|nr:glutamate--tRNA ligase [Candidatus Nealsonbacteria bacterium]